VIVAKHQMSNISAISCREQVTFYEMDDAVCPPCTKPTHLA